MSAIEARAETEPSGAAGSAAGRAPLHLIAEYTTPIVALAPAARLRWLAGAGAIAVLTIAAFAFAATRSHAPSPSPSPPPAPAAAVTSVEAPRPGAHEPAATVSRAITLEIAHEATSSRATVPITPPAAALPAPPPAPLRAVRSQPPPRGAWDPDALFPKD